MPISDNIRSAQFVDTYYPHIDGVVEVIHNYTVRMNKNGYACVVAPKAAAPFDDARLPYDVFRTSSFSPKSWQYSVSYPVNLKEPVNIALKSRPDILHVHSPFTIRSCALKIAKRMEIPLVATFHTKYYDDVFRITKSRAVAKAVVANIVGFYNQCDSVWACSEGTKNTLIEYGFKGHIDVMINGTDFKIPDDTESLKAIAKRNFHITDDKKNILFVGTQVWQKNMRLVLDTMKVLSKDNIQYRLYVAGSGYDEEKIHEYAAQLNLTRDQVAFLGKVTDRNLLTGLYLNADLFFFPSMYDNSPLVLREASFAQVPSLLVKGSNAAEVIIPDVNGFVAEQSPAKMAAKIRSVIRDEELLKRCGREAARTIPVSWDDIVPKVLEEYKIIIEKHKRRR